MAKYDLDTLRHSTAHLMVSFAKNPIASTPNLATTEAAHRDLPVLTTITHRFACQTAPASAHKTSNAPRASTATSLATPVRQAAATMQTA